jgi:hypothetical protein
MLLSVLCHFYAPEATSDFWVYLSFTTINDLIIIDICYEHLCTKLLPPFLGETEYPFSFYVYAAGAPKSVRFG